MKNLLLNSIIIAAIILGCSPTASPITGNEPKIVEDEENTNDGKADSVYVNALGMQFNLVKAGSFQMGTDTTAQNESPAHSVKITTDFYIGIHEVTQLQWKQVMGTDASFFKGDSLPVERVSFNDILAFIDALNELERNAGYRLPTEAEWEFAAKGGIQSEKFVFPGSNNLNELAWYLNNADGTTHTVGQKKANELGLFDMAGNVWEWCSDWYGANYYENSPQIDPTGPNAGITRVLRGGSWGSTIEQCRVSSRSSIEAESRFSGIGFRLVRAYP